MSGQLFNRIELLREKDVERDTAQLVGHLGRRLREERSRRRWNLRELSRRAGLSAPQIHWMEAGHPGSIESYVRLAMALGRSLDLDFRDAGNRRAVRQEDPVHAAMGELLAARLLAHGFRVAIDEPFQHFQFAGRADVLAWSVEHGALLHVENRTRFPNLQEAFGSYNAKRAYLPQILADRVGVRRFEHVTHAMVALWSSEVLHSVRLHAASFRAICPDSLEGFDHWWSGAVPDSGRPTSSLIVLDPNPTARQRQFVGLEAALKVRPRYPGYAGALDELRRA